MSYTNTSRTTVSFEVLLAFKNINSKINFITAIGALILFTGGIPIDISKAGFTARRVLAGNLNSSGLSNEENEDKAES